jgi:hypothetical protein
MKVRISLVEGSMANFESRFPLEASLIYQGDDAAFAPIAAMYGQFESYALRVEKMFDALIQLGGEGMISYMLNMGQRLSADLGLGLGYRDEPWINLVPVYTHGLKTPFSIHHGMNNLSASAVHFTDWAFQMAMDTGESGKLDFEHQQFDEFIQSLRDELFRLTEGK